MINRFFSRSAVVVIVSLLITLFTSGFTSQSLSTALDNGISVVPHSVLETRPEIQYVDSSSRNASLKSSNSGLEDPNAPSYQSSVILYSNDGKVDAYNVSPTSQGGVIYSVNALPIEGASEVEIRVRLDGFIGSKPNTVEVDLSLYRGNTRGTTGTYVNGCTASFKGLLGVKVGAEATCIRNISTTGFYFVNYTATAKNILGQVLGTDTGGTSQNLLNKRAERYPYYVDVWSGKVATEPSRADWPVVPVNQRTTWTTNDRANFIREYSELFPNNGWNWSGSVTNIHHIKPLKYGGNNDFSNLIPISVVEHYKFTSWFNNY